MQLRSTFAAPAGQGFLLEGYRVHSRLQKQLYELDIVACDYGVAESDIEYITIEVAHCTAADIRMSAPNAME
jgi:hypothetical protein